MDRIINVKVGGSHLSKDSKNAGVKGEANVTKLRITFDEGWDGYAKTVTFFDARGENPVEISLTTDLLENIEESKLIYLVPIPGEPMAEAGMLTFVIDGYIDGKRQRSIADELEVKDSPVVAGKPTYPTPTQAEQLQLQIEGIIDTIQNAVVAEKNAKTSEQNAKISEENAKTTAKEATDAAVKAEEHATFALKQAERAEKNADDAENSRTGALAAQKQAEIAISHNPVVVDGYWHVWSAQSEEYINTGVKAQAGSEVYIGTNPPDSADVIIDLDGESAIYAPYIGDNGNWYTFNPETQTFTDSGKRAVAKDGENGISCTHSWNGTTLTVKSASGGSSANLKGADGYTPIRGTDYWTEDDKAEIKAYVEEAILGGAW